MSANNKLLCLTICGYKKPSMSQADYRAYMTDKHAPLVQEIMARYGMLSYTQVILPPSRLRSLTQSNAYSKDSLLQ